MKFHGDFHNFLSWWIKLPASTVPARLTNNLHIKRFLLRRIQPPVSALFRKQELENKNKPTRLPNIDIEVNWGSCRLLTMADDARENEPAVATMMASTGDDNQPKKLPKGVVLGKDGKP